MYMSTQLKIHCMVIFYSVAYCVRLHNIYTYSKVKDQQILDKN
jgi:hypothetical protein